MLLSYRFTGENTLHIGIAVSQWFIKDEARIYVIVPQDAQKYCEVEVVYRPEYEWCQLDSPSIVIEFNSSTLQTDILPSLTDELERELYSVWDDGASSYPEHAAKLYTYFESLIDDYRQIALSVKSRYFKEEYVRQLKEAKTKSWDEKLIKLKIPTQAYDSH